MVLNNHKSEGIEAMLIRRSCSLLPVVAMCLLAACATVSKRMPEDLEGMHRFLTQSNADDCSQYRYNLERQAPRLYRENKPDSILMAIEYIKDKCGPSYDLETTRSLTLIGLGEFGDSLIGSATIPQLLYFRARQERLLREYYFRMLYGSREPVDNSHDIYEEFQTDMARQYAAKADANSEVGVLAAFYAGDFDYALAQIQSAEMRETRLGREYDSYVSELFERLRDRADVSLSLGNWRPQGANKILGNHPELGFQLGAENQSWRTDMVLNWRLGKAANQYEVDSLGSRVSTRDFSSLLIGVDVGRKLIDHWWCSTDIFVGLGYDFISSIEEKDQEPVIIGSINGSVGLRQRIFFDRSYGYYLGGSVRYSLIDYGNPGGSDMSGNSLTVSLMVCMSVNATLSQFLKKLNYRGRNH